MNNSSFDLMSYCSLTKKKKKNTSDREAVGAPFFGLTLYYRVFCF